MPDAKISELDEITALAGTEEFVVADSGTSKRITAANLSSELGGGGEGDPIFDKFGAPDTTFEFTTSSLTGLTALGTADVEDAHTSVPDHYFIRDDGSSWVGRYATAPSEPWTAIVKLTDHTLRADNGIVGMFVGEASPGIMDFIYFVAANRQLKTARWTNASTYSGDITATAVFYSTPQFYMAIIANSEDDVDFLGSFNGRTWIPITVARDPNITIGSIGLALNANSAGQMSCAFDYLRIWNSAETFPGNP